MKNALTAAVVAAIVAAGTAGAALTRPSLHVKRILGAATTIAPGTSGFSWASCPGQLKAVGGGIVSQPFSTAPVLVEGSYPLPSISTWEISVSNPNASTATVQAVAVCVG